MILSKLYKVGICLFLLPMLILAGDLQDIFKSKQKYDLLLGQERILLKKKNVLEHDVSKLALKIEKSESTLAGLLESLRRNNHIKIAQKKKQEIFELEKEITANNIEKNSLANELVSHIDTQLEAIADSLKVKKIENESNRKLYLDDIERLSLLRKELSKKRKTYTQLESASSLISKQGDISIGKKTVLVDLKQEASRRLALLERELLSIKKQARLHQEFRSLLSEEQFYGESQFIHVPQTTVAQVSEAPEASTSTVSASNQPDTSAKDEVLGEFSPMTPGQSDPGAGELSVPVGEGMVSGESMGVENVVSTVSPSVEVSNEATSFNEAPTVGLEAAYTREAADIALQGERFVDDSESFLNAKEKDFRFVSLSQKAVWLESEISQLSEYIRKLELQISPSLN